MVTTRVTTRTPLEVLLATTSCATRAETAADRFPALVRKGKRFILIENTILGKFMSYWVLDCFREKPVTKATPVSPVCREFLVRTGSMDLLASREIQAIRVPRETKANE